MFSSKNIAFALCMSLSLLGGNANSQELVHGGVVPLHKIPSATALGYFFSDWERKSMRYLFQTAARV